jgi:hypothetical protein
MQMADNGTVQLPPEMVSSVAWQSPSCSLSYFHEVGMGVFQDVDPCACRQIEAQTGVDDRADNEWIRDFVLLLLSCG